MEHFATGNRIELLRNGAEFFPALAAAMDAARQEVWLETYIFADDASGRGVAAAMVRAAQRGVAVRVLVDGCGERRKKFGAIAQQLDGVAVCEVLHLRVRLAPFNGAGAAS